MSVTNLNMNFRFTCCVRNRIRLLLIYYKPMLKAMVKSLKQKITQICIS